MSAEEWEADLSFPTQSSGGHGLGIAITLHVGQSDAPVQRVQEAVPAVATSEPRAACVHDREHMQLVDGLLGIPDRPPWTANGGGRVHPGHVPIAAYCCPACGLVQLYVAEQGRAA